MGSEIDINGPIGIFDSGFGGLTVARAVIDLLPNEDIVYIGSGQGLSINNEVIQNGSISVVFASAPGNTATSRDQPGRNTPARSSTLP